MKQSLYHTSVLVNEVIEYLAVAPEKLYVDATFGGGGHTRAILSANDSCRVIALDWDMVALEKNGPPLQQEFPGRLTLIWGNFADIARLLKKEKITRVDGILADFGTSQYQIHERPGFSFARDSILDMRMSPAHQKITAAEVVNQADEATLARIFYVYGEEQRSRLFARRIVEQRAVKPIRTTRDLAKIIESLVTVRKDMPHPATKVFQALRIYVNEELQNIKGFLSGAITVLNPGGRLVCISFHSLEDRLVKQFFKEHKNVLKILTKQVVVPTAEEVRLNRSARSAKLRAAEYQGDVDKTD